ncbi:hypothetical protein V8E51_013623 [Hyaloscypha variabilis]
MDPFEKDCESTLVGRGPLEKWDGSGKRLAVATRRGTLQGTKNYGLRFDEACARHASGLGASKIYILASKSLATKTDALQRLEQSLGNKIFWRERDAGKLIAFAIANEAYDVDQINTLWGGHSHNQNKQSDIKPPIIPVICTPTSFSGGEHQYITGTSEPKNHVKHIFEPKVDPNLIIQDPELCLATPHNDRGNVQVILQEGLKKLITGLLRYKHDESDLEARHLCQLGIGQAWQLYRAGFCFQPYARFNASKGAKNDRQEACKQLLLQDNTLDLGGILDAFICDLGMPRSLKDFNVGRDKLDVLVINSLCDFWIKTSPVPIRAVSQVMEILEMLVGK